MIYPHLQAAKYDLVFGMTQSESFHLFPAVTVTYGVSETEQNNILRLSFFFPPPGTELLRVL